MNQESPFDIQAQVRKNRCPASVNCGIWPGGAVGPAQLGVSLDNIELPRIVWSGDPGRLLGKKNVASFMVHLELHRFSQ
jgi:hypothetical protein